MSLPMPVGQGTSANALSSDRPSRSGEEGDRASSECREERLDALPAIVCVCKRLDTGPSFPFRGGRRPSLKRVSGGEARRRPAIVCACKRLDTGPSFPFRGGRRPSLKRVSGGEARRPSGDSKRVQTSRHWTVLPVSGRMETEPQARSGGEARRPSGDRMRADAVDTGPSFL